MLMPFIRVMIGGIQLKFKSLHCCYGDCNWLVKGSGSSGGGEEKGGGIALANSLCHSPPHRGTDSHLEWLIKMNMKQWGCFLFLFLFVIPINSIWWSYHMYIFTRPFLHF